MRGSIFLSIIVVNILLSVEVAFAQEAGTDAATLADLGSDLVKLAGVVVVVESALAAIFSWRVYRAVFNNRAWKTPIMFAVGLMIVYFFSYDIFSIIMANVAGTAAPMTGPATALSATLSALIIAGGSSGVNTLLLRLNIRSPIAAEPPPPVLSQTDAWVALRVKRDKAIGPIQVFISAGTATATEAIAGTVSESSFWERLCEAFSSDSMRFPNYGGRTVTANQSYRISVKYLVMTDAVAVSAETLVFDGSFAPRAVVNLSVTA